MKVKVSYIINIYEEDTEFSKEEILGILREDIIDDWDEDDLENIKIDIID